MSIRRFKHEPRPLKSGRGITKRRYWIEVKPGHPDYKDAPFIDLDSVYKELCKLGGRLT